MNTFEQTDLSTVADDEDVGACDIRFDRDMLFIELSDGRQIGLPLHDITWLRWLAEATAEQRAKWTIEPRGYAIWWDELDDGIEVIHTLSHTPLPRQQQTTKRLAEYA